MGAIARASLAVVVLLSSAHCTNDLIALETAPFEASAVSAALSTTLAVRDGVVYGAGTDADGQLDGSGTDQARFISIDASRTWVAVSAGDAHSCAMDAQGAVYCWGANTYGQLGVGDTAARSRPTPVSLPAAARLLAARYNTSCAILADDRLYCWGYNGENGLAQPVLFADALSPAQLSTASASRFTTVAVGDGHLCAIEVNGALFCSGRNTNHQAGTSDTVQLGELTQLGGESDWWAVNASSDTTCALRRGTPAVSGELWCWGENEFGQLAQGTHIGPELPLQIGSDRAWSAVDTSVFATCAVDESGQLACWGRNVEGQLGLGDVVEDVLQVTDTFAERRTQGLALGRFHTCVTTETDELWCTGQNDAGQLGVGNHMTQRLFIEVAAP